MQKDEFGVFQPIEWLSKSFDKCQLNWSIAEKECFAAIYAIEKWEKFLKPNKFVLDTDHENLSLSFNFAKIFKGYKLWRWALRLQEYNFTVTARPGTEQIVSDYLSRYNNHYNHHNQLLIKIKKSQTKNDHFDAFKFSILIYFKKFFFSKRKCVQKFYSLMFNSFHK